MNNFLVFLHLPKAAGTTFVQILKCYYKPSQIVEVLGDESIERIVSQMGDKKKRRIRCIHGHVRYGIHRAFTKRARYITFLREPVSRIESMYYYVKRTSHHYLHRKVVGENISFGDFVASELTVESKNLQVRLISGVDYDSSISQSTLEKAKERLSQDFFFVGLTEDFDTSLLLVRKKLGWGFCFYNRLNVSENCKERLTLDENTVKTIRENNKYDIELYNFAKELFRNSSKEYDGNLQEDLVFFREKNIIYQRCYQQRYTRIALTLFSRFARLGLDFSKIPPFRI